MTRWPRFARAMSPSKVASPGVSSSRLVAALGLPLLVAVASCEKQPAGVPSPPFEEVFALAEIIELGEDPSDSIAEVGEFFERRGGGFVIGTDCYRGCAATGRMAHWRPGSGASETGRGNSAGFGAWRRWRTAGSS